MSGAAGSLEDLVEHGATFMEVVGYLSSTISPLRPIDLLRALQDQLGIPFVQARDVLQFFGPQMEPIADVGSINERGQAILDLRLR